MKLIPLTILFTNLAVDVIAQKFRQQQFPFPPQFQGPNAGVFASDSTLYLPPESQTPIPYFPIKNHNLQFPYLPPTGTKAPAIYPTPFPLIISTTLVPNFEEEDDDDDRNHNIIRMSTSKPPPRMNQTAPRTPEPIQEKREMREIRTFHQLPFQQAMDRIDVKLPSMPPNFKFPYSSTTPPTVNQTPAARRMIISAETQKSDLGLDQLRAAASQQYGSQFNTNQGFYIPPSTTEPAIPILRLSNEMDLDGSFSYEALGADQTHYVQHSRMEHVGSEKEEQVVEGSYSYVGDNGQTYTVHYVADANGFRASGDHLPVAPPVPEIIQRAVQYNLAEEAKKPPHLKSWQDDGRDNELRDSSEQHKNFALPPPPRNLFTGRTPEAFSYNFAQGSNTQNNLVAAASNQSPIKTVDYSTEQPKIKPNNGPISPQITFLASQGAHVPSVNSIQDTISRMFTTEKPVMPQIVNYEAGLKEADQEANKEIWRWQYGLNANNLNQNPSKEAISRSSGEDDIMINFSDMTPEQYTRMIRAQLESGPENEGVQQYVPNAPAVPIQHVDNNQNKYYNNNYQNEQANMQRAVENQNNVMSNSYATTREPEPKSPSTEQNDKNTSSRSEERFPENYNLYQQIAQFPTTVKPIESRDPRPATSRLITQKDFLFPTVPSHTITQSYNFEDTYYEPRKLRTISTEPTTNYDSKTFDDLSKTSFDKGVSTFRPWGTSVLNEIQTTTTQEQPLISSVPSFKFTDFIVQDNTSDFRPITTTTSEATREVETTTTEKVEDLIENNIFLKSILKPRQQQMEENKVEVIRHESKVAGLQYEYKKPESNTYHVLETQNEPKTEEPKQVDRNEQNLNRIEAQETFSAEPKTDKVTKLIPYYPQPSNEIKELKKKPIDIAEVLNYVSMKNLFESSKMKPKSKTVAHNQDQRTDIRFIPIQHTKEDSRLEKYPSNFKIFDIEQDGKHSNVKSMNFNQEPKPSSFKAMNFEQEKKQSNFKTINYEEQRPNNFRTINYEPEEVRGNIKNYKVLHRNNKNVKYDVNTELKTELSPPPLKAPSLPPLGRAGPSMKSYLPPIYV